MPDMIHVTNCPCCGAMAQAIDHGDHTGWRAVRPEPLHEDIVELCDLLGLFSGAQPRSPREVMRRCLDELRRRNNGG